MDGNGTNGSAPVYNVLDDKVLATVYLITLIIFGTFGNTLIIVSVILDKSLRSFIDVFICNVAFMDLIVTSIIIPSMVPLLIYSRNIYPEWLCKLLGLIAISFTSNSQINMTIIALNRYIYICHRNIYSQIFTKYKVIIIIISSWIFCLLLNTPVLYGWGSVGYVEANAMCIYDHLKSLSNFLFMSFFLIGLPFVLTYLFYGRIGYILYKSKQRVGTHTGESNKKKHSKVYSMFFVSASFTLIWFPYATVTILDNLIHVNDIISRIAGWFGLLNSCVNAAVLAFSNRNYKEAFRKLLCRFKNSSKKDTHVVTMHSVN